MGAAEVSKEMGKKNYNLHFPPLGQSIVTVPTSNGVCFTRETAPPIMFFTQIC